MAKIARITNFTKFYTWKEKRSRRASRCLLDFCAHLQQQTVLVIINVLRGTLLSRFVDISGPFLASLLSKSGILLHLLFLRFFRYLSGVF